MELQGNHGFIGTLQKLYATQDQKPTPPENIPGLHSKGVEMFCFCNKNL